MADQPKTGPTPAAPDPVQQPNKTTDTKSAAAPTAAPIAAATAPIEPKKS